MAAAVGYGKRCVMQVINSRSEKRKRSSLTPEQECKYWVNAGIDKEGFDAKYISDFKGFGVFSTREHQRGDFLLQYVGEYLKDDACRERERTQKENMLFFFKFQNQQQCIDASRTVGHICQLVNDGPQAEANCKMKLKIINKQPKLCLFAIKDIASGQELTYDYGDQARNLWWRRKVEIHSDYEDDADDDPFDVDKISDYTSDDSYESSITKKQKMDKTREDMTEFEGGDEMDKTREDMTEFEGGDEMDKTREDMTEFEGGDEMDKTREDMTEFEGGDEMDKTREDMTEFEGGDEASMNHHSTKQRPTRMCPFCKKVITGGKIKRHIITHRKTHPEIEEILKKHKNEQTKWFNQQRIEGMYMYNIENIDQEESTLMRARKPTTPDSIRMCSMCKTFLSSRTFYKHRKDCSNCHTMSDAIKMSTLQPALIHKDSKFIKDILNKFRDNEVGNFIRSNDTIKLIGYKHFLARQSEQSKVNEVRRDIMMEMRELARLFIKFRSISTDAAHFESMYERVNLNVLKEAMSQMCESENGEKFGLKVNINSIFKRSIKILTGHFAQSCQDEKMKKMKKFREAYEFSQPEIIAKARYETEKRSLNKARAPQSLPLEADLAKLRAFIKSEIEHTVANFDVTKFTWLRSLIVTRLTLYNARRGEEGSRLTMEELHDALEGKWVPSSFIKDPAEEFLIGQFKLAYMSGKGRKYVPVLLPLDLVEAVKLLVDNRTIFGIEHQNNFVFATKSSNYHCSGWHAVAEVCEAAGVSVNATRNRHRASTLYASLDMDDADRRVFFDHLGHDETINKENYQCPPGIKEIRVMGKFLNTLEGELEKQNGATHSEEQVEQHQQVQNEREMGTPSRNVEQHQQVQNEREMATSSRNETFKWSKPLTQKIQSDFSGYITALKGSKLPKKADLEAYRVREKLPCTYLQLRTKVMNELLQKRSKKQKK